LLVGALATLAPAVAAPATPHTLARPVSQPAATGLQAAFSAAAQEFGVPERVLLAVSYNLSRWDTHSGAPSVAGGYGPMHLTHVAVVPNFDARGDDGRASRTAPNIAGLHTLDSAAALLGLAPEVLERDAAQNIRGGAALLAQYARGPTGALPASDADWYAAVAAYSQASDPAVAADFADAVYATIQQGATRTTDTGETVTLPAANVAPNRPPALQAARQQPAAECPSSVDCEFVPAAYILNDPADPSNYGNCDLANRPNDGLDVRYIVIHDTEVDYNTTLQIFENPLSYVSSHYVVRSSDGHIAQMVQTKNVAWHAGNWYVNGHAIGIEHEGFAIYGATWYTENMYRASARLVRYLGGKYHIPLDRAHIIGHDDVPGPTPPFQAGMHWDPGPFWDWNHYMELIGAPIRSPNQDVANLQDTVASDTGDSQAGDRRGNLGHNIITIAPRFDRNQPPLTYCYENEATDCRDVPAQPSNFVYLYTAPDRDAPLITNQYISATATLANNWANKAVTGQQFYRLARVGDWDGIYFGGQIAWFYNPHQTNTVRGQGILIKPKSGRGSIPVYGRAYPEAAAYPAGTTPQSIEPIYTMPGGQIYVASGPFKSDYYWAPTYAPTLEGSDHVVVKGQTKYYQIFYNHRFAFVMASDVDVVHSP
jgi:N-acetyl-anhydromuramyl-L-alanine amidase AmpD